MSRIPKGPSVIVLRSWRGLAGPWKVQVRPKGLGRYPGARTDEPEGAF